MRHTSHCRRRLSRLAPIAGALVLAWTVATAGAVVADDARWRARGDGIGAQAAWRGAAGTGATLQCEQGDARLLLRIDRAVLPAGLEKITLIADGTGMDYPVERANAGGYVSKIALDAPILDRMLLARAFTLQGGGRSLQTGIPGEALARVVRACRAHHWPREARIDPSDAGFAKK